MFFIGQSSISSIGLSPTDSSAEANISGPTNTQLGNTTTDSNVVPSDNTTAVNIGNQSSNITEVTQDQLANVNETTVSANTTIDVPHSDMNESNVTTVVNASIDETVFGPAATGNVTSANSTIVVSGSSIDQLSDTNLAIVTIKDTVTTGSEMSRHNETSVDSPGESILAPAKPLQPPCEPLKCAECPFGNYLDANGCPICKCKGNVLLL